MCLETEATENGFLGKNIRFQLWCMFRRANLYDFLAICNERLSWSHNSYAQGVKEYVPAKPPREETKLLLNFKSAVCVSSGHRH